MHLDSGRFGFSLEVKEEEWEEKAEVRAQREALKWRQKEEEWEEKEAHLKEEVEALQA